MKAISIVKTVNHFSTKHLFVLLMIIIYQSSNKAQKRYPKYSFVNRLLHICYHRSNIDSQRLFPLKKFIFPLICIDIIIFNDICIFMHKLHQCAIVLSKRLRKLTFSINRFHVLYANGVFPFK